MTIRAAWIAVVCVSAAVGCTPTDKDRISADSDSSQSHGQESLVQFSLLAALAADDYTSGPPLRDVLEAGDFGIGTFHNLDGEMIVLDGEIYQALADGTVRRADRKGTTPFAAVTHFKDDGRIDNFNAATLADLDSQLDRKLPRPNSPYALRIDGDFKSLTLRSVPAQKPPFRRLIEVVKDQATWQRMNVRGTLVGMRCPEWMSEVNVSGYHWHFLSDDKRTGGHVLACEFGGATLRYDECNTVVIHIPNTTEFDRFNAGEVSDEDIEKIERHRTDDPKASK